MLLQWVAALFLLHTVPQACQATMAILQIPPYRPYLYCFMSKLVLKQMVNFTICDWILENRSKLHVGRRFEVDSFKDFKLL